MKKSKFIRIKCLSVHIGSQILNHKPYEKMLGVLDKLLKRLKYKFDIIDLGGGMGISYEKNNRKLNYNEYKKSIIKFSEKSKMLEYSFLKTQQSIVINPKNGSNAPIA